MLTSWIRKLNHVKIRNKLIVSYLVVVFVPVLMVGVFLTGELREMALRDAVRQTSLNVERVRERLEETMKVPIDISNRLMFDERLKELVNTRYETTLDVFRAYWTYPDFKEDVALYKEISGIRFYITNPTLLNNWEFIYPDARVRESFWYREVMNGDGRIRWYSIKGEDPNRQAELSLIRRIDFPEHRTAGLLVVSLDTGYLNRILARESYDTFIADEKGVIVAANRPERIGKTMEELDFPDTVHEGSSGTYEGLIEGEPSRIMIDEWRPEYSSTGVRIISVFSVDSIVAEANRFRRLGLGVMLVSVLVSVLLIWGFSLLMTGRLLKLSRQIGKVARGQFHADLHIDGHDEIGQLAGRFNFMVDSIRELMQEVERSNRQKHELEIRQNEIKLKMMASQINPHFLYNALESIRMKAHIKGESEIARVVKLLGRLMRKNLEVGGRAIPLREEIERVRCYLEIQRFRYEDRFTYHLDIGPETEETEVPPLIVQPLVENAVIHGFESKEEGGTIWVRSRIVRDELRIEVEDNGTGMREEKRREVERMLENGLPDSSERERIGLSNVHQRLKLSCGGRYGLSLDSAPDRGTRVTLTLPARRKEHV